MKSIVTKYVLALCSILISTNVVLADRLYIDPFSILPGETKEVMVNLSNSQTYTAFQAEMRFPEGLELVKQGDSWMTLTDRANDNHSLIVNTTGRENVKIVCFSSDNSPFSGEEGALMKMSVRVDESFQGGDIEVIDVRMSDKDNKEVMLEWTVCRISVTIPTSSIVLSQDAAELKVGEVLSLTATVYPEDATDKTVSWTSDNTAVASVDDSGNVYAVALGSAVITASCGDVVASCTVTVVATPAESIVLSQDAAQLKVGENVSLTATVYPEDATDKTVSWTSDNTAVASVDDNGNVTAVSLGSAVITASCGDVVASCTVTVVATPAESIVLSQDAAQLKVGENVSLTATVYPEDATDKTVAWTSNNESVATVDSEGNVTAINVGEADIIVMATDGSEVSAVCHIIVDPVLVESITLTPDNLSGEEGETIHIEAVILPENASDKSIIWSSSDENIATVDTEGTVVILKEGSCVVTATAADGSGVTAECIVTGIAGIDEIFSVEDLFDIYNINGILIKKDCDRESLKSLAPDIYILRQGDKIKKLIIR